MNGRRTGASCAIISAGFPERNTMFGTGDVEQLIECAARALEAEDRYLIECANARHWRGGAVGIRDNINERYYQFVIWRALMRSFRWRPRTERQIYDLAFYDDETNKLVAVAEIKGWWSASGEEEIPRIRQDIEKKLRILRIPGVMLILTSQKKADAEANTHWLAGKLGVNAGSIIRRSFDTPPWPGDNHPTEFAILGFLVSPTALEESV
jgi:hypothetical protein